MAAAALRNSAGPAGELRRPGNPAAFPHQDIPADRAAASLRDIPEASHRRDNPADRAAALRRDSPVPLLLPDSPPAGIAAWSRRGIPADLAGGLPRDIPVVSPPLGIPAAPAGDCRDTAVCHPPAGAAALASSAASPETTGFRLGAADSRGFHNPDFRCCDSRGSQSYDSQIRDRRYCAERSSAAPGHVAVVPGRAARLRELPERTPAGALPSPGPQHVIFPLWIGRSQVSLAASCRSRIGG